MSIEIVGHMPGGRVIERMTLSSGDMTAQILTYGAIVQSLRLAPFDHSLVLGLEDAGAYLDDTAYLGAVVGPVANRIAGGAFELGGQPCSLTPNEGPHSLHGGPEGVSSLLWRIVDHGPHHCTLSLMVPGGHMGFPGPLHLTTRYAVGEEGVFDIAFEARAGRLSVCALAPHLYLNLDGQGDARDHGLEIAADHVLPVMPDLIPTGERRAVVGTPWDFHTMTTMRAGGVAYDHNFCLAPARRPLAPALLLKGPVSGIEMALETTEPGVQIYDGAGLDAPYSGIAIEPQMWPDAPNHHDFPDITLPPGEPMRQRSRLKFMAPLH